MENVLPDRLPIHNYRSDLSAALVGQKRFADAEPPLLASFKALKRLEKTIPLGRRQRLPEVVDRLIERYMAANKRDEFTKLRQERATYTDALPQPANKK